MAITAAVVERTPHRLVYRLTQDGAAGAALTIPNDNGATPDLGTDSLDDTPLGNIMDRARDTGVALNQAGARALLLGDGAAGGPGGNFASPRAHCFVVSRDGVAGWGVDANVDGGGDPVLAVVGPAGASVAYLHVIYQHSSET